MKRIAVALLGLLMAAACGLAGFAAITFKTPERSTLVSPGDRQTLLITNARIFTATATSIVEAHDVVVAEGRIQTIVPAGQAAAEGARVIDAQGQTLLPGFIDFHTHPLSTVSPPWYREVPDVEHTLQAYLFAGVTTIVSMGIDLDEAEDISGRLKARTLVGPRLLYAGSPITIKGGHPQATANALVPWPFVHFLPDFSSEVETVADAEAAVNEAVDRGATLVKLVLDDLPPGVPKLADEHVRAIVRTAHKRRVKVAAHIGTAEDALRAASAGVDVLNHGVHRGPLSAAQAKQAADTGVLQSPTLIIFERCAQLALADMEFGPQHREIEGNEILDQFKTETIKANAEAEFLEPWLKEVVASREQQRKNAFAMYKAGVPILVGTDSPLIGNVAGASLHDEMQMLVAAGIPEAQVLLGATARPAAFLADEPDFGTIEVGKRADLVLIGGDPLKDINATRQITHVIQDGRLLKRLPPQAPAAD